MNEEHLKPPDKIGAPATGKRGYLSLRETQSVCIMPRLSQKCTIMTWSMLITPLPAPILQEKKPRIHTIRLSRKSESSCTRFLLKCKRQERKKKKEKF